MVRKYQIVLKPIAVGTSQIESGLILFNGEYLINQPSNLGINQLVTVNTSLNYLSDPSNINIVSGFTKYVKDTVVDIETFEAIYYDANRVTPILNDYYRNVIVLNQPPRTYLLNSVLSGGTIVYNNNNNYDLETDVRIINQEKTVITTTEETSYYLDVYIPRNVNELKSGDYSKYFKDSIENGVVLTNAFIDLNKKDDPFEYWS